MIHKITYIPVLFAIYWHFNLTDVIFATNTDFNVLEFKAVSGLLRFALVLFCMQ
ncbi:hypothetical protein Clocl_1592 [Acetivibrio clariflavus DSM 19732]|uniref:Uncharacterized protein n=1 Tax=Acetivibrio clariflavus (strain DSM 19732 / NBRC 101661 / EBR45) TaxID=720554 RepID=G8M2W3_ACECE|nr:hypothetical protein Clocl_1592 [Acetivibrio clariflavus DSM 19732]